jgi:N-acetylglucosaminyldiphosphoundecaprenol N-acetyl-beta-D-mannosaminyltransferase
VGLEWLWRIKEEPHLWPRYAGDAFALAKILATRALPLLGWSIQRRLAGQGQPFRAHIREHENVIIIAIAGSATANNISHAVEVLRQAIALRQPLRIDLSATTEMDTRFIGLILMAMKQVQANGGFRLINLPPRIRQILVWNGFRYILEP